MFLLHEAETELARDGACTGKKGIYLREEGEWVGPFSRLADAEIFLALMKLFGENCEGIEIIIEDADNARKAGCLSPGAK